MTTNFIGDKPYFNTFYTRGEGGQNPPPNLGIKTEISRLWSIPDHQEGIRCKAPRSDD
jgi:hypothetical protein